MRVVRAIRRAAKAMEEIAAILDGSIRSNRVEKKTDFSRCPNPVLLLHGFFTSRRTFDVLERRLRRDGYGVFTLDLGGLGRTLNTRGIDDLADLVRAKIERIYARNPGLGPLTIVGHSKGGLIAAYYVKKLGGWRRTRAVVTLGTPHHGTPLAYLGIPVGFFARSLWQLFPGSPFLTRLADGPWPGQVRLASIWSKADEAAPYPTGVIETHGLPHLLNVEVNATHGSFLTSRRIYAVILREVRAAEEAAPIRRGPLTGMRGGVPPLHGTPAPARVAGSDAA
jgi:triacylglycerol esterase/lipase EstA (alpha/beta hydrolase family)